MRPAAVGEVHAAAGGRHVSSVVLLFFLGVMFVVRNAVAGRSGGAASAQARTVAGTQALRHLGQVQSADHVSRPAVAAS